MLYVFHLMDSPEAAELRQRGRPAHKAYIALVADRIAFAGPLLGEDGNPAGSLLVIDFLDRDAALAWISEEPFTLSGVYSSRQIHAFQNLWPQRVGFPDAGAASQLLAPCALVLRAVPRRAIFLEVAPADRSPWHDESRWLFAARQTTTSADRSCGCTEQQFVVRFRTDRAQPIGDYEDPERAWDRPWR